MLRVAVILGLILQGLPPFACAMPLGASHESYAACASAPHETDCCGRPASPDRCGDPSGPCGREAGPILPVRDSGGTLLGHLGAPKPLADIAAGPAPATTVRHWEPQAPTHAVIPAEGPPARVRHGAWLL